MRREVDFIGEMEIPDDALFGIHSVRARNNFPDGTRFHIEWFKALGMVKKACYQTAEAYKTAMVKKYGEPAGQQTQVSLAGYHFQHLIHAAAEIADGEHFDVTCQIHET